MRLGNNIAVLQVIDPGSHVIYGKYRERRLSRIFLFLLTPTDEIK